jgi:hypothetical protein
MFYSSLAIACLFPLKNSRRICVENTNMESLIDTLLRGIWGLVDNAGQKQLPKTSSCLV